MIRVLSLFSGIGAFETALDEENIDWELDHYCEIDKYASMSYNQIHGTTDDDNLKDVTKIDYSKIGDIDLVTYGFPCQDISIAGNQKGFFDENGNLTRSGLFFNAADIIRHTKPKFAIFENVKNLTGKKFKKEFETVISVLNEIGYVTYWKVLNASEYGVPQNRERVFGVSIRKDINKGFCFPNPKKLNKNMSETLEKNVKKSFYLEGRKLNLFSGMKTELGKINVIGIVYLGKNESNNRVYDAAGISPTINTMQGGHRQPKIYDKNKKCARKLTPRECWRLMGFQDKYFDRVHGVSDTQLYKQAGNSIVVDVLMAIFRELKYQYKEYFFDNCDEIIIPHSNNERYFQMRLF